MTRLSPRRAVNEIYLHLLAQRQHHDNCSNSRCVPGCEIVAFHQLLEEPLLASEQRRLEAIQNRLEALVHGDIPA